MKCCSHRGMLLADLALGLITGFGLIPAGRLTAQNLVNDDGANPRSRLLLSGNTVYGTAMAGGASGMGTVFAVNTDGTGFTTLHNFDYDGGADPVGGLALSGKTLYGAASGGGNSGKGAVFALNTDGTGFSNLHSFNGTDGTGPSGGLILSGKRLYGATPSGGNSSYGTVFALNTDGTGFTNLHHFTGGDGANPSAELVLSANGTTLFGRTPGGGSSGYGTIFAVNTDGTGFRTFYNFTNGTDLAAPQGLTLLGDTLYGTERSGSNGLYARTLFAVSTDGTSFRAVRTFGADSDGFFPSGTLTSSGQALYGTTFSLLWSSGTIFAADINGTGFTTLHSFTNSEGSYPYAGLMLSEDSNTLFGTASSGGAGNGTVFAINTDGTGFRDLHTFTAFPRLPDPQLTIVRSGTNVVLTWPDLTWPVTGGGLGSTPAYVLQSTTNLISPVVWSTPVGASVAINGLNVLIILNSARQQFYRLVEQSRGIPGVGGCRNSLDCPCGGECIQGVNGVGYCFSEGGCPGGA